MSVARLTAKLTWSQSLVTEMQPARHVEASARQHGNASAVKNGPKPLLANSECRGWKRSHIALAVTGSLVFITTAFLLLEMGVQLGRAFNAVNESDVATRFSVTPDNSYPCGPNIGCFEKGRYQPIWL